MQAYAEDRVVVGAERPHLCSHSRSAVRYALPHVIQQPV